MEIKYWKILHHQKYFRNVKIDGHHRWLAMVNVSRSMRIPIIRVKAPMGHVLALTKMYPKVKYAESMKLQAKKDASDPDGGVG